MSKSNEEYEEVEESEEEYVEEGLTSEETKTEGAERKKYMGLTAIIVLVGQILAWSTYFATHLVSGQKALHDKKFAFIHEYQLGYIFLAHFIIYLTRSYLIINANGARKPTGLDRPDQHIYVDERGVKVSMANDNAAGRFNRAQRATYNMDETLPVYVTGLILAGTVFGPVMLLPALFSFVGRIAFANGYTKSAKSRSQGFLISMIAEGLTLGLVGLCAIKGVAGPKFPF